MEKLEAVKVKWRTLNRKNRVRIFTTIYILIFPVILCLSQNELGGRIGLSIVWGSLLVPMLVELICGEEKARPFISIQIQIVQAVKKHLPLISLAAIYISAGLWVIVLVTNYNEGKELAGHLLSVMTFASMTSLGISKTVAFARRKKTQDIVDTDIKYIASLNIHLYVMVLSLILYLKQEWFAQFVSLYFPLVTFVFAGGIWVYDGYKESFVTRKKSTNGSSM